MKRARQGEAAAVAPGQSARSGATSPATPADEEEHFTEDEIREILEAREPMERGELVTQEAFEARFPFNRRS